MRVPTPVPKTTNGLPPRLAGLSIVRFSISVAVGVAAITRVVHFPGDFGFEAIFADQRDVRRLNADVLGVSTVAQQDDFALRVVFRDRIDGGLQRGEVPGTVRRDHDVRREIRG